MPRKPSPLGVQELEVLRFVTARAPITVRDVAQEWGVPRALARTTILTMMERLRKKGFLVRRKAPEIANGADSFVYEPVVEQGALMRDLVTRFVQTTLGGSVSPFVAYLADAPADLSENEIAELRRLVDALDESRP